jgi:hypothetical protein
MTYAYKQVFNSMSGEVNSSIVLRLPDNATIPFDPDNTDYIAFLKWIEEGNVPTPAEENQ